MKAYVMTTGALFGLLTVVHIWRIIAEGGHPATELPLVLITIASAGMCVWALHLLRKSNLP